MDDNSSPGGDISVSDAGFNSSDLNLGAAFGDLDTPLGFADQACKECRRRKSKCNKAIPTCNLCVKYRRHCLYEKHSRTPLTRKHLTEVEERLERAEHLVRQMRAVLPPHLLPRKNAAPAQGPRPTSSDPSFDFSKIEQPGSSSHSSDAADGQAHIKPDPSDDAPFDAEPTPGSIATPNPSGADVKPASEHGPPREPGRLAPHRVPQRGMSTILESPPVTDDFEWDEQDNMVNAAFSPDMNDADDAALDGMASLTVSEKEGGYLGVASGAAFIRLLEPSMRRRSNQTRSRPSMTSYPSLTMQPNPNRQIADIMIDAYFKLFHLNYPIIHEPTFRAQFSEIIPRPHGDPWLVLAYVVAAIGVWSSAKTSDNLDLTLFAQARSILSFNFLELGNLTLVQALTLTSNYQQKRDRPNSAYNYLGLAVRMAMGLGLHKEFQGWNISPLNMEIRRRVWWSLCVFDCGATITFSRPLTWPFDGVEVSLPRNVHDRELTPNSLNYPPETEDITPYTAVRTQAAFHVATNFIYRRVIGKPLPSAEELVELDKERIEPWIKSIPPYFAESAKVPPKYTFAHVTISWRYRNFRIIMYRPFVIRKAFRARDGRNLDETPASLHAYNTCLADAKYTIQSISNYWVNSEQGRMAAWYALYFIFQAALIPCICLRNLPLSDQAADWRQQINTTLQIIAGLAPLNASAQRCYGVIAELCGRYLDHVPPPFPQASPSPHAAMPPSSMGRTPSNGHNMAAHANSNSSHHHHGGHQMQQQQQQQQQDPYQQHMDEMMLPIDESPQTQMNSVYPMMWPNVPAFEAADQFMDDAWMDFLGAEGGATPERGWYGQ
ncbi:hypothetical protein J7T55_007126 [Diaporthe amygdali]|uniref:uncharacterized protein n=1 Tax=Phomopsis amygdali TaxID=1214568 RepID=UPI0022FDE314|nr:uncharacterized protein J7T55_007126 [Diaporthe amygdali]KAJ0107914.1 hypothetical protein J7T55_007126 [Diaporthe amygdali]